MSRNRLGAVLLLVFFAAYGALSFRIPLLPFQAEQPFHARTAPQFFALAGLILALVLLLKPDRTEKPAPLQLRFGRITALCVLMLFYGFTVRSAGFLIATSFFLIGGFFTMGERRLLVLLFASIPVVVGLWLLMTKVLGVFVSPWPAFLM